MWNKLMNIRKDISKHLKVNVKHVYNNAIYYLQKRHFNRTQE